MRLNLHFTNVTVVTMRTVDCSKCEYRETDYEVIEFFSVLLNP